jgi:hypothetical protein
MQTYLDLYGATEQDLAAWVLSQDAVNESLKEFADAAEDASEELTRSEGLLKALEEVRAIPGQISEGLNLMMDDLKLLMEAGADADEILAILGDDMQAIVRVAQQWGVVVPDIILDLLGIERAADKASDSIADLNSQVDRLTGRSRATPYERAASAQGARARTRMITAVGGRRQGSLRTPVLEVESFVQVVDDGLGPVREFTNSLSEMRRVYSDLGDQIKKAVTPLERFAQLEQQLIQEQELMRLAQYVLAPAFTTGQAVTSIVQQALGLAPELAGHLVSSAIGQFGPEATFGAVELLRRREFGSFAEALGAATTVREGPGGQGLNLNLNVTSPDPNATHEFILSTWIPAFVAILQNRQDGGQILDLIRDQFEDTD